MASGETNHGNLEVILGSAVSIPLNIITGLADLLIMKGIISREEMANVLQGLLQTAPAHGDAQEMVRMIVESTLARYQSSAE
jgi:hypothetical protein